MSPESAQTLRGLVRNAQNALNQLAQGLGAELDDDYCSDCGADLDLDGWDGRCGNCADLHENGDDNDT